MACVVLAAPPGGDPRPPRWQLGAADLIVERLDDLTIADLKGLFRFEPTVEASALVPADDVEVQLPPWVRAERARARRLEAEADALDAMGGVDGGAVEAADYGDDDEDDVYDDEDDPFGLPGGRFYGR